MTDNRNNQPEQPPRDEGSVASDLSNAAKEAMRMLREAQKKATQTDAQSPKSAAEVSSEVSSIEDSAAANEDEKDMQTTGMVLGEGDEEGNTTNDLQQEAFKAMKLQAERKREAEEKARTVGESLTRFTKNMALRLEPLEEGEPIEKTEVDELIVGRGDNVTDYVPDIDLTPHGAYRLGLSRRHAVIQYDDDRLLVKDLNSRNGTFVNGAIVPGGAVQVIRNGDEVRFGNLVMKVVFLAEGQHE